jgi:iron(III) transport system substrate-binding protein
MSISVDQLAHGMPALVAALAVLTSLARAQEPSWVVPELLAPARAEGVLTVYGSMNEQEALPLWRIFEQATGIKTDYVRASDTALIGRIVIERRAQQRSWDLLVSTAVSRLPPEFLAAFAPPQAQQIRPEARDQNRRWYGVYANYNTPAYNTRLVKAAELPNSYEEFAARKEWAGKVALDQGDVQWLSALYTYYGEERARKLAREIGATLNPVIVDGHLALARSVAAGEYWVALNNYLNLTLNLQLAGATTDFWPLEPVALFFGQVGVSSLAAHPNAAQLAANFLLSKEAQQTLPRAGRVPVRPDVAPNPADAISRLQGKTVIAVKMNSDDERKWRRTFQELFRPR